jgi:hypothetical protein
VDKEAFHVTLKEIGTDGGKLDVTYSVVEHLKESEKKTKNKEHTCLP